MNTDNSDKVTITIGKPEALILFELLADFHSDPVLSQQFLTLATGTWQAS